MYGHHHYWKYESGLYRVAVYWETDKLCMLVPHPSFVLRLLRWIDLLDLEWGWSETPETLFGNNNRRTLPYDEEVRPSMQIWLSPKWNHSMACPLVGGNTPWNWVWKDLLNHSECPWRWSMISWHRREVSSSMRSKGKKWWCLWLTTPDRYCRSRLFNHGLIRWTDSVAWLLCPTPSIILINYITLLRNHRVRRFNTALKRDIGFD